MSPTQDLAPVFARAAEVIKTNGHVKGRFYEPLHVDGTNASPQRPSEECPVCAVGALRVAAGYDPDNGLGLESWQAIRFLSPRVYSNTTDADPVERIADWNDAPERTADEVVAALLDAAEAARLAVA